MLSLDMAFWTMAVVTVVSAAAVVLLKDVFRAALCLVLTFMVVAGLFVLLSAEFLAVVQVLIYAGAISILIIFAIMLTRDVHQGNPSNRFRYPALVLAALLLAAIVLVVIKTDWNQLDSRVLPGAPTEAVGATETGVKNVFSNTTPVIARLLLRDFVLPFEVASVLLLAAILGALALVREGEG
ncbi:MAG: NADH-ubiquinone oxidoreductase chain [Dehalococcoidia bacterium]|nr:NADH-ubiquinone oxidoreductase chain [Dehalococcoidia bacterium]